jgi:hypothetical protein
MTSVTVPRSSTGVASGVSRAMLLSPSLASQSAKHISSLHFAEGEESVVGS